MKKPKKCSEDRIHRIGEFGTFSKSGWVNEAEGKLTSSKFLREIAKTKKVELKKYLECNTDHGRRVYNFAHPVESTNKSSFLLLGYAIELLLKSGVVSLLINSPKKVLENQVKDFGHNLSEIAETLHIPLENHEIELLQDLSSYIVLETRYPVTAESKKQYFERSSVINSKLSQDILFDNGVVIYEKIKKIIDDIDGTRENPKSYFSVKIDDDGYFTFRTGGAIPPVCIIKYSAYQKEEKKNNLECLKEIMTEINEVRLSYCIILNNWERADFYEVVGRAGREKLKKL